MQHKPTKKVNIVNIFLCMAVALFMLTFALCLAPNGSYAKYIVSDSGEDEARVATFKVSSALRSGGSEVQSFAVDIAPGGAVSPQIEITNDSEVAVQYTIAVGTAGNLPLILPSTIKGTLAPNKNASETFTISWNNSATDDAHYQGQVDHIRIFVTYTQID